MASGVSGLGSRLGGSGDVGWMDDCATKEVWYCLNVEGRGTVGHGGTDVGRVKAT